MAQVTEEARAALVKAADNMARFYDAHRREAPKYNVGDKVWLSLENIRTVRPTKKLNYKWLSPYVVERVISRSAYRLKLPASFGNIHPVFSITLLHPFEGDSIAERQECHPLPPPPIVRDGIEEYEVEKILNSRILCGKVEYLVCWKGYGVDEDEWGPVRDVQGSCHELTIFTTLSPPRMARRTRMAPTNTHGSDEYCTNGSGPLCHLRYSDPSYPIAPTRFVPEPSSVPLT